jgi:plasmid rolling circle replication initiator protein Rep
METLATIELEADTSTQSPTFDSVLASNKFFYKIANKSRQAKQLCMDVRRFLKSLDIDLPIYLHMYKAKKKEVLMYDIYDDALEREYGELINMIYAIENANIAIGNLTCLNNQPAVQLLACWYSKQKMDPVWQYRKPQIYRKKWCDYLKKEDLHTKFIPAHLTLTVPHSRDGWQGNKFYAQELIQAYYKLRKTREFKKYIYGGCYNVEISYGEENGFHIHIHSLMFQHPEYTINEVRDWIAKKWKEITGNTSDYSGIHYESLYFYEKTTRLVARSWEEVEDEHGAYDYEPVMEERSARKKVYINQNSSPQEYLRGVMECLKYQLKPGDFQHEDGSYNIPVVNTVLKNTKNLHFYGRFGKLLKVKELCFNKFEKPAQEQTDEELEEEVMASVEGVEQRLISSLEEKTGAKAELNLVMIYPRNFNFYSKDSAHPYQPIVESINNVFFIDKKYDLKEGMALIARKKIRVLLDYDSYERLKAFNSV